MLKGAPFSHGLAGLLLCRVLPSEPSFTTDFSLFPLKGESVSMTAKAMHCPLCDIIGGSEGAFCTRCGTRLECLKNVPCSTCGSDMPHGARYCKCGTHLSPSYRTLRELVKAGQVFGTGYGGPREMRRDMFREVEDVALRTPFPIRSVFLGNFSEERKEIDGTFYDRSLTIEGKPPILEETKSCSFLLRKDLRTTRFWRQKPVDPSTYGKWIQISPVSL
jgi:hypothetical protein